MWKLGGAIHQLPFKFCPSPFSVGSVCEPSRGSDERFPGPLGFGSRVTGWLGHFFLVTDRPYRGFSQMNEEYLFLNPAIEPNEPHWDKRCLFTNYVREGPGH